MLGVDGFSITGVKYMFETDTFSSNDQPAPGYVNDGLGPPVSKLLGHSVSA